MKCCDILELRPVSRDVAHRMFAALAARHEAAEEPSDELGMIEQVDREIAELAELRESTAVRSATHGVPA